MGNNYDILIGDCRESLRSLPPGSVHTCVTSPPYFGLRDYGHEGQIGLEPTPDEFVAALVEVFRDVRRVLRDDGTVWLNLGDSYAAANSGNNGYNDGRTNRSERRAAGVPSGIKPKDLIGIPWRVAFALQADGWYLRQDIIWHKPNPMPESVTDRCTKAHEYIFLLSKSPKYYFDSEAVKEDAVYKGNQKSQAKGSFSGKRVGQDESVIAQPFRAVVEKRNRRSVWTVTTKPFKGGHFATYPPDLIEPCILAGAPEHCCSKCGAPHERITTRGADAPEVGGSDLDRFGDGSHGVHRKFGGQYQKWLNENPVRTIGYKPGCNCDASTTAGTVLDPFFGSGTTGVVALRRNRKVIGCEINPDYALLAYERLENE